MTLFTEDVRVREQRSLDEFAAPLSDVLGATFTQSLYDSPTWQIGRRWNDSEANSPLGRSDAKGPRVDRQTAMERAKAAGVELKVPDDGLPAEYLDLLIKRKKEFQERQDIISRAPKGIASGTAQFVTGFGASMLDPINIAASFVPVGRIAMAGTAARASTGATLGARTLARAQVGAVEGAVGQALLEPLTYYSYSQEQLDYTISDSFQNIAFGAILGSALHTGFGLVGDRIGRPKQLNQFDRTMQALDPTVREIVFKADLANRLEGRRGDVEPIAKPFTPLTERPAFRQRFEGSKIVDEEGRPLELFHGTQRAFQEFESGRGPSDGIFFTENPEVANTYAMIDKQNPEGGNIRPVYLDLKNPLVVEARGAEWFDIMYMGDRHSTESLTRLAKEKGHDGVIIKNVRDGGVDTGTPGTVYVATRPEQIISKFDDMEGEPRVNMDDVARSAEQRYAPENNIFADFDALREVDEMAAAPKANQEIEALAEDTTDIMHLANEVAKQLGVEVPEFKAIAEFEARSQQYSKAVKAAAICGIRG